MMERCRGRNSSHFSVMASCPVMTCVNCFTILTHTTQSKKLTNVKTTVRTDYHLKKTRFLLLVGGGCTHIVVHGGGRGGGGGGGEQGFRMTLVFIFIPIPCLH